MDTNSCSTACEIILKHGFPIVGFITATMINTAPFKTVQLIRESKSIGSVNTFPFPMIVVNAISWIIYGMKVQDFYVVLPNIIGFFFGVYYTLSTYPFQTQKSQKNCLTIIIGFGGVIFLSAAIAHVYITDVQAAQKLLGIVCVVILIVFYASPLSTISHILKTKDASSIHPGLAIASLVNGVLWSVYGIVIGDWFVSGPNLLGTLFAIIQLVLLGIFKKGLPANQTEVDLEESFEPCRSSVSSNQ